MEQIDKLPPQAPDIERAIVGAMLIDTGATERAFRMLTDADFYKPANAMIFSAIKDLWDQDEPVDQLTVAGKLESKGQLEMIGGEIVLSGIISETASSANIDYHCGTVVEKKRLREIITLSTTANKRCYDANAKSSEILGKFTDKMDGVGDMGKTQKFMSLAKVMPATMQELVNRANATNGLTGIDTGFSRLNTSTGGWQSEDYVVVGGYSSAGKTTWALNSAVAAAKTGVPVGIFSLEMSAVKLNERFVAKESSVAVSSLHEKKPGPEEWKRLTDAMASLYNLPIYIDDVDGMNISEFTARATLMKREHNIGLLVLDYIQLMQGQGEDGRQQQVESISRGIKRLTKRLKIPIIALCQLTTPPKGAERNRPSFRNSLRNSSAIGHDADTCILLWEPEEKDKLEALDANEIYYEKGNDLEAMLKKTMVVIVEKQRNGPTGQFLTRFDAEHYSFEEIGKF